MMPHNWPLVPSHPTRTKEVSKGISPAKEVPENIVSAAEGEGEFRSPSIGSGATWPCWRKETQG